MQRTATPLTPVRFRPQPPFLENHKKYLSAYSAFFMPAIWRLPFIIYTSHKQFSLFAAKATKLLIELGIHSLNILI